MFTIFSLVFLRAVPEITTRVPPRISSKGFPTCFQSFSLDSFFFWKILTKYNQCFFKTFFRVVYRDGFLAVVFEMFVRIMQKFIEGLLPDFFSIFFFGVCSPDYTLSYSRNLLDFRGPPRNSFIFFPWITPRTFFREVSVFFRVSSKVPSRTFVGVCHKI